jgi:Zn-dependent peptidase ImmA (M78 family)
MERGFKAKANRVAVDIRTDLGLRAHDPLDPLTVCNHFEIVVIPLTKYGQEVTHFKRIERGAFSAVTVPCGLQRAIVHNDTHSPDRQRSNIMHELAHAFLGHPPCSAFSCDGERHYDSGVEAEAAFLGGALLITNEAAWHIVRVQLRGMARQMYGVSQSMLDYRLRISGALTRAGRLRRAS